MDRGLERMRLVKKALALLLNIFVGFVAIVSIIFIGAQTGPSGIFLYVFVTVVWSASVLEQKGKPTLLADLLQSLMALAWTFLNGLLYGSVGLCFFNYVAVLCVLCAVRMAESEA